MGHFLFLLATAALFVRPAEIFPAVQDWPIYEFLILACLAVSLPGVFKQLSIASFVENPITACIMCLWVAVVLSHLVHFVLWGATMSGFRFFKIVVYYLLLVAHVDSEEHLRGFLRWLLLLITLLAAIALLSAHDIIKLPDIDFYEQRQHDDATGQTIIIPRLRGTGIFNDPNDLAMILVLGVAMAMYVVADPSAGILRPLGLAQAGLFGYAIYETQSRGGLLALLAALATLCYVRWGWKRTALVAAIALPALLVGVEGRMTNIDDAMGKGTAQSRVQLWSAGVQLFRHQPVFGIGQGSYAEEVGQVAHNSFLHAFTELGFVGGAFFLGTFTAALLMLRRLRDDEMLAEDRSELMRMLPYLMAMLVGFVVSMLSLSRNYFVPTYLVLGVATSYVQIATGQTGLLPLKFDSWFLKRLAVGSVCFLAAIYVFVRVTVQWS